VDLRCALAILRQVGWPTTRSAFNSQRRADVQSKALREHQVPQIYLHDHSSSTNVSSLP
jgi:hypothetical protein